MHSMDVRINFKHYLINFRQYFLFDSILLINYPKADLLFINWILFLNSHFNSFSVSIYQFIINLNLINFIIINSPFYIKANMVKVIFPSRPKPQQNKQNNNFKDKQKQKQKKMFIDTIKDMRQIVQKHYGSYNKDTLGMLKHNTKVPYNHLMGRREKITERYAHQKARAKQENIQFDSSLKLLNSNIIQQSKRQKDEYQKNKYKFQGENLKEGRLGKETDGMLILSKQDIRRINGKPFESSRKNYKGHKEQRSHQNFKIKPVHKGTKNNQKGGKRK